MTLPLWFPWIVAIALIAITILAMAAEPRDTDGLALRRARFAPLLVIAAALVAVAAGATRLSDERLLEAGRYVLVVSSHGSDRVDVDDVITLLEHELGVDLDSSSMQDVPKKPDVGDTAENKWLVVPAANVNNVNAGPAICFSEDVRGTTDDAGRTAYVYTYTVNSRTSCLPR